MSRHQLGVLTPWYPSLGNPVLGNFVAEWSRLAAGGFDVRVVNSVEWPGGPAELVEAHRRAFDEVVARMARAGALDARGDFGRITRVPHVLVSGWSVPERAESAVRAVAAALPDFEADVLHGHVGYFGGLVAARLAPAGARVVVTEHSSEARTVLADPRGRELYAEVLERAFALTCVSGPVRDLFLEHLPEHRDKVVVIPNPVDFAGAPRRAGLPDSLDRWVFVGGLTELKGVRRLLAAFTAFASGRSRASLDLFGDGPLRAELDQAVAAAGLGGRVTFHGNVPKATVLEALPAFDVLVGPSRYETFHLAVSEAVAAGLPVVVTRSGGPEEALGDTMRLCGRFIDVADSPDEILDAVADLEQHLGTLDLDGARAELDARFGPAAVRARLADLYGVEPWGAPPHSPRATATPPERVEVFARRTWRSPAVEPQIALARSAGADVEVVGVPQPAARPAPLTVPQRALRKAGRLLARLRPPQPTGGGPGTVALLGDMTSAADVATFWSAHPSVRPSVELDPTDFGHPPVDAHAAPAR